MTHYFHTPDDLERRIDITVPIDGIDHSFFSAPGVFSSHRLDIGTSVLLKKAAMPPADFSGRILDLGCGFGPIAITLAKRCPQAKVDAVDVNSLARILTAENAIRHGVDKRVQVGTAEDFSMRSYDFIYSNPPIRIGKEALHTMLLLWLPRLTSTGEARCVVGKNLGADSLQRWLIDRGFSCEKYASAKGFRILTISHKAP